MNTETKSLKALSTLTVLLTLATAYLVWQQHSLKARLAVNAQQCDARVSALLEAIRTGIEPEIQIVEVKTAAAQNSTKKEAGNIPAKESRPARLADQPKLQSFDETLEDIVKSKYRFLLARLDLSPEEKERLLQLLMERENTALKIKDIQEFGEELGLDQSELSELEYQLEQIDSEIADILGDEENSKKYVLLKDSDDEQEEFTQYTLGIAGLFPLSQEQQEKVLFSRLGKKHNFINELKGLGFDEPYPLTEAQQNELLGDIEEAISSYKHGFLDEIRPHLNNENGAMDQYTLMENYTNTEFELIIEQFRDVVLKRGTIWN